MRLERESAGYSKSTSACISVVAATLSMAHKSFKTAWSMARPSARSDAGAGEESPSQPPAETCS